MGQCVPFFTATLHGSAVEFLVYFADGFLQFVGRGLVYMLEHTGNAFGPCLQPVLLPLQFGDFLTKDLHPCRIPLLESLHFLLPGFLQFGIDFVQLLVGLLRIDDQFDGFYFGIVHKRKACYVLILTSKVTRFILSEKDGFKS